jgi:hypothetical protein
MIAKVRPLILKFHIIKTAHIIYNFLSEDVYHLVENGDVLFR